MVPRRDTTYPAWYTDLELDQEGRWAIHEVFWKAVAGAVRDSPAVLGYDLMNEPTLPGASSISHWGWPNPDEPWSWVQNLSRDGIVGTPDQQRDLSVAKVEEWVMRMRSAIHSVDLVHMITVGYMGNFPGGAEADCRVLRHLDFVSIHIYPRGVDADHQLDQDIAWLDAWAAKSSQPAGGQCAGSPMLPRPLVLGETGVFLGLRPQLNYFMRHARSVTTGFIAHYFGRMPGDPIPEPEWGNEESEEDYYGLLFQRESLIEFESLRESLTADVPRMLPTHEYYSESLKDHFFTTHRRDALLALYGYDHKGAARQGQLLDWNPGGGTPLCSYYDHEAEKHHLAYGCPAIPAIEGSFGFDGVLGFVVESDPSAVTELYHYTSSKPGFEDANYYTATRQDGLLDYYGWQIADPTNPSVGFVYPE